MKTDIVTKTRNTKWKFIILIFLVSISIFTFILNKLGVLGFVAMGFIHITCILLFFLTAWLKNYKANGHIELGENSIRIYEQGELTRTFNYKADKIKSVTIKWQAFTYDFVRMLNGFFYLNCENDSLEIKNELECFSFNIIMGQSKDERKAVDWIFDKLAEIEIKTGYERKLNYAQQFLNVIRTNARILGRKFLLF